MFIFGLCVCLLFVFSVGFGFQFSVHLNFKTTHKEKLPGMILVELLKNINFNSNYLVKTLELQKTIPTRKVSHVF